MRINVGEGSRSLAVVEVEENAETFEVGDPAFGQSGPIVREGKNVPHSLVAPLGMVVGHELRYSVAQRLLSEQDQPI